MIGEVCLQFLSTINFKYRQYEVICNQDDHFQLIVHGIELCAAFEERKHKQSDS